jgi:hypothetical protein
VFVGISSTFLCPQSGQVISDFNIVSIEFFIKAYVVCPKPMLDMRKSLF